MSRVKSEIFAKASEKLESEVELEILSSVDLDINEVLNEDSKRDDGDSGAEPDNGDSGETR